MRPFLDTRSKLLALLILAVGPTLPAQTATEALGTQAVLKVVTPVAVIPTRYPLSAAPVVLALQAAGLPYAGPLGINWAFDMPMGHMGIAPAPQGGSLQLPEDIKPPSVLSGNGEPYFKAAGAACWAMAMSVWPAASPSHLAAASARWQWYGLTSRPLRMHASHQQGGSECMLPTSRALYRAHHCLCMADSLHSSTS